MNSFSWSSTSTGTTGGTIFGIPIYIQGAPLRPPPPPPPVQLNVYSVLGLPPTGAPPTEVRKAYRQLAKKHHPDLGGDIDQMKLINAAYDFLKERKLA